MANLLDGLNPKQREAAETVSGPLLILAGAGSGKTRVITYRVANLIRLGVRPFNILAITFTNKAAKEMKARIDSLVGAGSGVFVSTFHSLCVRILRREISQIGFDTSFTIYDADDSERLIKLIVKEQKINDKLFPIKTLMHAISQLKDELMSPAVFEQQSLGDYRQSIIARVYTQYQKKLKENNALDFDDLILKTVELFLLRVDTRNNYHERFRYILVDEYQDTNTAQYTLVRLLSQKYGNICVVGDDDQSIYGWRGANIQNILNFEDDFPNAKVVKLEQNYRSTQTILSAANAVISHNIARTNKRLWTEIGIGVPITAWQGNNEIEEGEYIADTIKQIVNAGGRYSDCAILYRTNSQSRAIEDCLVRRSLPYRIYGGVRFYERKEIKDILAYLRAIYNPFDSVSLLRIINTPRRGIGEVTIEKFVAYANANDISLFESLKEAKSILGETKSQRINDFVLLLTKLRSLMSELPVTELIKSLLDETNYTMSLLAEGGEESKNRIENIGEFVAKATEFEKNTETPLLSTFLEEVSLVADIDAFEEGADTVSLMTLHSSKGLEFPNVFISGFEEGLFPSFRAQTSGDIKDLEEERRLCYVGITRAKTELYLTMAVERNRNGQTVYNIPSSFLKEIPEDYLMRSFGKRVNARVVDDTGTELEIPLAKSGIGEFRQKIAIGNKPAGFGGKSYLASDIPEPEQKLEFSVGDRVRAMKYGIGEVTEIVAAGADFEVTVQFPTLGAKKFMAHLSKLKKVK